MSIVASLALVAGATFALFSDSETSEDNIFTAGSLDLQVDYDCYYNQLANGDPNCPWDVSSWQRTDLGVEHKFFNFDDVKPGDFGEGTISLHVFDNDAWGRMVINDVQDLENTCTTQETEAGDTTCTAANDEGELRENIPFSIWLDDGATAGFQCGSTESQHGPCPADTEEGDNLHQEGELTLVTPGNVDLGGETHNIYEGLAAAYVDAGCTQVDGNTAGGPCHGLAQDGRMLGSVTYYFGIDWEIDESVDNSIQTDSLGADIAFEVEQHRNNPTPFGV
jgi:predicted ribosomally synthesized peptide with SipW-like signal peptide